MPPERTYRQHLLGNELCRLREAAGLTQEQAAERLRYSKTKMSRIESGQVPDFSAMESMLDKYGVLWSDWPKYERMWTRAKEKGWWHRYGLSSIGFVSMEHEASHLAQLDRSYVPGMFQTEDFMRQIYVGANPDASPRWIENVVKVRLRRQERLTSKDRPLAMHSIFDEAALYDEMPPGIMRDQLRKLIRLAAIDTVTMQMLPRNLVDHEARLGPFTLLRFPEPDEPDRGYSDHAFGSARLVGTDDASAVNALRRRFDRLPTRALSPADSLELLEKLAANL
jgi:transcriptional regulator with XRE-family HTH domain